MSVTARSILRLPLRISPLIQHCHVYTMAFQPFLNTHQLPHHWMLQPSCSYTSRYSGFADPGIINELIDKPEIDELEDDEEIGNYISLNEGDSPETLKEEMEREDMMFRRRIKQKIIEKKHFRPPKEINLLTWQAKDQIHHLNRISEEKWTPEYLAYHFPVSRDGVIRILRNAFYPDSEREVEKHDGRVKTTWKRLKELSYIQRDAKLTGEDEELWNGVLDRLSRLANATGISSLPMPKKPNFDLPPQKPHGPFGSLIWNHRQQLNLIEGPASETAPKLTLDDIYAENETHLHRLLRGLAKAQLIVDNDELLSDKSERYPKSRQAGNIQDKDVQFKHDRLDSNRDIPSGHHTQRHADKMTHRKRHSGPGPAPVTFRYRPEPSQAQDRFNTEWNSSWSDSDRYKQNHYVSSKFQSNRQFRYPDKYVDNHSASRENVSEHTEPKDSSHQDKYYAETVYDDDGNLLYRIPG